jgi:hypothetical protein
LGERGAAKQQKSRYDRAFYEKRMVHRVKPPYLWIRLGWKAVSGWENKTYDKTAQSTLENAKNRALFG